MQDTFIVCAQLVLYTAQLKCCVALILCVSGRNLTQLGNGKDVLVVYASQ